MYNSKTAETIWQKAIAQGVIPATLKDSLPQVEQRFQNLASARVLDNPALVRV